MGKILQYMCNPETHVQNTLINGEDKPIKMAAFLNTLMEKVLRRPHILRWAQFNCHEENAD